MGVRKKGAMLVRVTLPTIKYISSGDLKYSMVTMIINKYSIVNFMLKNY